MLIAVAAITLSATNAHAATSEVKWKEPNKYIDIDAGRETKSSFRKRLFKRFEKHFTKLAGKLPDNKVLTIEVTDVDLAGNNRFNMDRVRIIKEIDFPRMTFTYQVKNADGTIFKSGEAKLKDMSFMSKNNFRYKSDFIGYEKRLLDDWFKDEFESDVVAKH